MPVTYFSEQAGFGNASTMSIHMRGDGGEEGGEGVLGEFVAGVGQNRQLCAGDVFGQGLPVGEGEERVKLAVDDEGWDSNGFIGAGPIFARCQAGVVEHRGNRGRVIEEAFDLSAGHFGFEGGFASGEALDFDEEGGDRFAV